MRLGSTPAPARPAPAVRTPTVTTTISAARMSGRRTERMIWARRSITGLLGVCDSAPLIAPHRGPALPPLSRFRRDGLVGADQLAATSSPPVTRSRFGGGNLRVVAV